MGENVGVFGIALAAYLISYAAGFCASVALHELGHLVCGLATGYRFVSFRLLKCLWAKDEAGRIRLTKGAGLGGTLGQCLMEPPDGERRFRFALYNLGGGLANLITGSAFLAPVFLAGGMIARLPCLGAALSAIILGIVNLIPLNIGALPNDGKNTAEALKSGDGRRGLFVMLKANAEMAKGKALTDYDENAFAVSEDADVNNFLVAYLILLRSSQLEEEGAYELSYHELSRPDPDKLPPYYGGQLTLCLMFHELVYFGDEPSARRASERIHAKEKDKLFQKLMKMRHPAFMPFYAAKTAFIDNDADKAREIIAQARQLNPSQQNPGAERTVSLMLGKLESRMRNGVPEQV